MKVTLINVKASYDCMEPLGILYIGTYLKKFGHDVQLTDVFFNDEDYLERIKSFGPELIGLSVTTPSYVPMRRIIPQLRAVFPYVFICAGGVHPTNLPELTMQDNPELDFVVAGEGEYALKQCIERLAQGNDFTGLKGVAFRKNNSIVIDGYAQRIEDLDSLPIPERGLLDTFEWYLSPPGNIRGKVFNRIARVITSRGCPYDCIFCTSHSVFGKKVRRRSIENVLQELKYLQNAYHIKGFYFVDDTFTVDKKWVMQFCEELRNRKMHFVWTAQVRVDTVDEPTLRMMRDAGCLQVDIGVESGSDKVLQIIKKGITTRQVKNIFTIVHKLGLRNMASFIIGHPGEFKEDILMTRQLVKEIKPDWAMFNILSPLPGSEIFEMAKANHWFRKDYLDFSGDWSVKTSEDPVIAINFTKEELVAMRADLDREFFAQNYFLYFIYFLKYPIYFIKLIISFIKYLPQTRHLILSYVKSGKARMIIEVAYQKFNQDLVKEMRTRHNKRIAKHVKK